MPRGKPGVPVELRESRLLAEFLATRYKGQRVSLQPRVGAIQPADGNEGLPEGEIRMLSSKRRYPDAIVLLPDRVVIIEAALRADVGKLALLDLYARLFPVTPDFLQYRNYPVEKLLVSATPDAALEALARSYGIRVEVYQPEWVSTWLASLRPRDRRAPPIIVSKQP